ncbi:MAG: hypothetical protein C3F11_02350 [Methylocystaceae bacterium]|nr:MAG: hypothetical protein C3F11_02350 [Methylocystaceae bacterium]
MTPTPFWPSAIWLFVVATAIHNLEETIWLPSWRGSRPLPWTKIPVDRFVFGFAANSLSVLFFLFGVLAVDAGPNSLGAYLICGSALAMALNVFFPHLAISIWTRSYAPGAATAALLVLPASSVLIINSIQDHYIDLATFMVTGPLTVLGLVISIPALFLVGRAMQKRRI